MDRRYKLLKQGLPGPRAFEVGDLNEGDIPFWNGERWAAGGGSSGTWTPELQIGTSTAGISYVWQNGAYYKVGRIVFIKGGFALSSVGTRFGTASIIGLPFTVADDLANTGLEGMCEIPLATNMSGLAGSLSASIIDDNRIGLYAWSGSGTSSIDDTSFTDSTTMRIQGVYLAEA